MTAMSKVVPRPTPDTQPYFDAASRGVLSLPRCDECQELFFYPRSWCPRCSSDRLTWVDCSGRATLYSYVIASHAAQGFDDEAPYAIALVQLEEGPRLMANVVGIPQDPEHLILDMPLQVIFERRGDITIPNFTPAGDLA